VVIRGVNVYPSAIEDVIRACGGVAEFRAEITTVRAMTEISLKIEPAPAAPEDLTHHLESGLRDALGLRIPTEIVEAGTLPRFEMKARRWVRS
jgi:phenylacetate-CoA ligase